MSRTPLLVTGDNPPGWCLRPNAQGELPTCTYVNGEWHRSYEGGLGSDGGGAPAGFVLLFVLALLAGIAFTVWRVSTARRMARDSGISESDATAMTLLSDDGFEATYLASNLRGQTAPTPPQPGTRSTAERLRELQALLEQGLITEEEYAARRRAVIEGL